MRIYEINRKHRIESIRKGIQSAREKGEQVNFIKLELYIMEEYGISKRTAKEYIEVANNIDVKTPEKFYIPEKPVETQIVKKEEFTEDGLQII